MIYHNAYHFIKSFDKMLLLCYKLTDDKIDMNKIKKYLKKLKNYLCVIYFAYRDPEMPLFPKIFAAILMGYAASPIDLIPDFIPVLGYLDDLIILSIGAFILLRIIPKDILQKAKEKAEQHTPCLEKKNWFVGALIVLLWLFIIIFIMKLLKIF